MNFVKEKSFARIQSFLCPARLGWYVCALCWSHEYWSHGSGNFNNLCLCWNTETFTYFSVIDCTNFHVIFCITIAYFVTDLFLWLDAPWALAPPLSALPRHNNWKKMANNNNNNNNNAVLEVRNCKNNFLTLVPFVMNKKQNIAFKEQAESCIFTSSTVISRLLTGPLYCETIWWQT